MAPRLRAHGRRATDRAASRSRSTAADVGERRAPRRRLRRAAGGSGKRGWRAAKTPASSSCARGTRPPRRSRRAWREAGTSRATRTTHGIASPSPRAAEVVHRPGRRPRYAGTCGSNGSRRHVEEPLEQVAVALDRHAGRAAGRRTCGRCPRGRPRRRRPARRRGPDRASPSTSEATSSPTRNSNRPGGATGASTVSSAFSSQPGKSSSSSVGGPERASAPQRQLAHGRLQLAAVVGELVDTGGGRRRQPALGDDAARLEVAQPGGEDVRADPGQLSARSV